MFDISSLINDFLVLLGISATSAFIFRQALSLERDKVDNEIDNHLTTFFNSHKKLAYPNLNAFKKSLYQDKFKITFDPDYLAFLSKIESSLFWTIFISVLFVGSVLLLPSILPFFGLVENQGKAISNVISSYGCLMNLAAITSYLYYFRKIDWKTSVKTITMFDRIKQTKSKL